MKTWIQNLISAGREALANPAMQELVIKLITRVLFGSPAGAGVMAMVDPRYKIRDPEYIRREVIRLNLPRRDGFDTQSKEAWASVYNGWGPDCWPYVLRSVITWIERYMEVLAGPHDDAYAHSDGTIEGWRIVMRRWIDGTPIVLNDRFPARKWWLWPMRAWVWIKARAAIAALEKWSFDAWMSAHERGEWIE